MKVKLVNGKLVVEEDKDDFMNIVTPNGHTTRLCYQAKHVENPKLEVVYLDEMINRFHHNVHRNTIIAMVNTSAFGKYLVCAYELGDFGLRVLGWYDVSSRQWIHDSFIANPYNIQALFERVEFDLIEFILKYDRECENAKYLRIIGEFCVHLVGRPKILDLFSELSVQNSSVNDQKEKEPVKPLE
jgi:hypothetical protein